MITIRRATRADAAAIGRIHVETWQATYSGLLPDKMLAAMSDVRQSSWWARALADPDEARGIFVADDSEAGVVGFGSGGLLRQSPKGLGGAFAGRKVGEVYTLYVESDFQNQGLGRRLLDALFRQLAADGCSAAVIWMLDGNPNRFFYEGLGGSELARRREPFAGADVEEVAYVWHDLRVPLLRRRLAPEED